MSELWERIKQARKAAGLTQEDLAARCGGITRNSVAQWESSNPENRTTPQLDRLRMIAKATNTPLDQLLSNGGYQPDGEGSATSAPDQPAALLTASPPTAPPLLTPRQQALLGYFDGLTEEQQEAVLRELSEKKQVNQAIVEHFRARQKAS
jgi:transcriptional regulator with XRE-family HTH domain